jgi:pimeloyl-ACP methyl ester carboxylesterase
MMFMTIRDACVQSADGTEIAYRIFGNAPEVFVLAPGLGVPYFAHDAIIKAFAHRYRFVMWNMRGTYRSGKPPDGRIGINEHVEDLEAIVKAERLERFVLGGWSLGVQISLEYAWRHADKCQALVLINGTFGRPMQFKSRLKRWSSRLASWLIYPFEPVIQWYAEKIFSYPDVLKYLLIYSGLAANNIDQFLKVANSFTSLPVGLLSDMLFAADQHTAEPYLPFINIPCLVTIGTADWMTPPEIGQHLVSRMPDATLLEVKGGTHYTPIEFPNQINDAIHLFLNRVHAKTDN